MLKVSAAIAFALATQGMAYANEVQANAAAAVAEEEEVEHITITGQVLYTNQVTALNEHHE